MWSRAALLVPLLLVLGCTGAAPDHEAQPRPEPTKKPAAKSYAEQQREREEQRREQLERQRAELEQARLELQRKHEQLEREMQDLEKANEQARQAMEKAADRERALEDAAAEKDPLGDL